MDNVSSDKIINNKLQKHRVVHQSYILHRAAYEAVGKYNDKNLPVEG